MYKKNGKNTTRLVRGVLGLALLALMGCDGKSRCEQLRDTKWGKELASSGFNSRILDEGVKECEAGNGG